MKRGIKNYLLDLYYGATKYPCGWSNPKVVCGYFTLNYNGYLRRLFFQELCSQGFKRTFWQLVFPGQTAGLIKSIPVQANGVNEYHVRFYNDGIIECELEVSRFNSLHWHGHRLHGEELLDNILKKSIFIMYDETKEEIRKLFGTKPYTANCSRINKKN